MRAKFGILYFCFKNSVLRYLVEIHRPYTSANLHQLNSQHLKLRPLKVHCGQQNVFMDALTHQFKTLLGAYIFIAPQDVFNTHHDKQNRLERAEILSAHRIGYYEAMRLATLCALSSLKRGARQPLPASQRAPTMAIGGTLFTVSAPSGAGKPA